MLLHPPPIVEQPLDDVLPDPPPTVAKFAVVELLHPPPIVVPLAVLELPIPPIIEPQLFVCKIGVPTELLLENNTPLLQSVTLNVCPDAPRTSIIVLLLVLPVKVVVPPV